RAQRWFAAAFLDQLQIPEGQQWESLENFRNLTLLSLPVTVDGGQVLHYRDLDSTSSLAFLPEESDEPAAPLAISPRTWSTIYGFDALESTIVFSHREPRTEGRDRG